MQDNYSVLEVFRNHFYQNFIANGSVSHAFGHAESNGAIYFALRVRERLPQSAWKYPPKDAFQPLAWQRWAVSAAVLVGGEPC